MRWRSWPSSADRRPAVAGRPGECGPPSPRACAPSAMRADGTSSERSAGARAPDALDRAFVSATAPDGPRLFVVEPRRAGSRPRIVAFDRHGGDGERDHAVRRPGRGPTPRSAVPTRTWPAPGFWHGGAGVAAVLVRRRARRRRAPHGSRRPLPLPTDHVVAVWGRVHGAARRGRCAARPERRGDRRRARPTSTPRTGGRCGSAWRRGRGVVRPGRDGPGARCRRHSRSTAGYATHVADLQLYLRQLRSEAAAAEFGDLVADEPVRW